MPSKPQTLAGASVLFDLDGTLVDTAPDLIGALGALMAEEGLEAPPFAEARPMIGAGARRLIQRAFAAAGAQVEETARIEALFSRYIALYQPRIAAQSRTFEGVREALAELEAAGARMAVATNKPTALALELLTQLDLTWPFRAVVGPEFAPAQKPDPRHLLAAIERSGGRGVARAVMIGDSVADAHAARSAGVRLVLTEFGYSQTPVADLGADAVLRSFAELPTILERLLACDPVSQPV
ncbi:MAG: HAD-IA family hydrolase [Caulobacteraceae bacterium]